MSATDLSDTQRATRASWNFATRMHNTHKGDQAAFLRGGGDTLFPEELELLGPLEGRRVLHAQCNSGQDTLCLARRGAQVVGVDLSDEAITFARRLSAESGLAAEFEEAELTRWLASTPRRFDVAFASYGVLGWHEHLAPVFEGLRRVLVPGGRLVIVEFHPLVFSLSPTLELRGDDYFQAAPFTEPVGDYVGESAAGLLHGAEVPTPAAPAAQNPHAAYAWQHGLGATITAAAAAGLSIRRVVEWPHTNGWRPVPALVADGRRWVMPPGYARVPMMFGLVAERAADEREA